LSAKALRLMPVTALPPMLAGMVRALPFPLYFVITTPFPSTFVLKSASVCAKSAAPHTVMHTINTAIFFMFFLLAKNKYREAR
jgi:hypothetical protein